MAGRAFVDTNVLLRSLIDGFPESEACRALVLAQRKAETEMWISRQVVRELLVQLTHPRTLAVPLTTDRVLAQVNAVLRLFRIADETRATTRILLMLLRDYGLVGKQIHDANYRRRDADQWHRYAADAEHGRLPAVYRLDQAADAAGRLSSSHSDNQRLPTRPGYS